MVGQAARRAHADATPSSSDRVHHAYLFVGSRGTGKTSMAKILAACLNCVRGADGDAVRRLRLLRVDRRGELAGRDRDGRRLVELGRRHPRAARVGRLRAGLRPPEGLHPRRGAHALDGGLERVPQDARGAAAEHRLRARDDRGPEGAADRRRPLPPLRLPAPDRRADRDRRSTASPRPSRSRSARRRSPCSPATPRAASATRSARSSSCRPTPARQVALADVLAVLGISDAELLFGALRRDRRGRSARARSSAVGEAIDGGRDPAAFIRELEAHARELLIVADCTDGVVPAELSLTPERDERLAEQARTLAPAALVRTLDLLGGALDAPARRRRRAHPARAGADQRRPARPRSERSRRWRRASSASSAAARAALAAPAARRASPPPPRRRASRGAERRRRRTPRASAPAPSDAPSRGAGAEPRVERRAPAEVRRADATDRRAGEPPARAGGAAAARRSAGDAASLNADRRRVADDASSTIRADEPDARRGRSTTRAPSSSTDDCLSLAFGEDAASCAARPRSARTAARSARRCAPSPGTR